MDTLIDSQKEQLKEKGIEENNLDEELAMKMGTANKFSTGIK